MHNSSQSEIVDLDCDEDTFTDPKAQSGAVVENSDGTRTIILRYPISITFRAEGGKERAETYDRIDLRRVTAGDLMVINRIKDEIEQSIQLMTRLSNLPKMVFEKMDADDFATCAEVIGGFLERVQKIGRT